MYRRNCASLAVGVLLALASGHNAFALSPPWETLHKKILYTLGEDPDVRVDPVDTSSNPYVITLHVGNSVHASALASFIVPKYVYGNITVNVRVVDSTGAVINPTRIVAANDIVQTYVSGLYSNRLFAGAFPSEDDPNLAGVVFQREIVQFFEDDIGEVYGNYNAVAASVFAELLKTTFEPVTVVLGTLPRGIIPQLIPDELSTPAPKARKESSTPKFGIRR